MKKLILFAAILFAGVSVVKSANPIGQSTLNVVLNPVQSISVNSSASATIEYTAIGDYAADKVQTEALSNTVITVNSAGKFIVAVSAPDLLQEGNTANKIPSTSIGVEAINKGHAIGVSVDGLSLGNSAATLINGATGGLNLNYDIKFTGKGRNFHSG